MTQKAAGGSNALQDKSFFLTDSYTQSAATNRNTHIRRCVVCCIAGHPPSLSILLDTPARPPVPGILSVHACAGAPACRPQSCSLPAQVLCAGDTLQESTTTKCGPNHIPQTRKTNRSAPKGQVPRMLCQAKDLHSRHGNIKTDTTFTRQGLSWHSTTPGGVC
jgi:hypothetical protein